MLELYTGGKQQSGHGEHRDPQRARRGLDAFAGVEHRAVPGEDLVDDAQVDERVLVHPAVLPTADRDHERGNVRRRGRAESGPARRPSLHLRFVVLAGSEQRRHRVVPRISVRIQRAAHVAAVGVK